MDMLERRLGVGRKFHHLRLNLRLGGESALRRISLLPWLLLISLSLLGTMYPCRLHLVPPGWLEHVQPTPDLDDVAPKAILPARFPSVATDPAPFRFSLRESWGAVDSASISVQRTPKEDLMDFWSEKISVCRFMGTSRYMLCIHMCCVYIYIYTHIISNPYS